MKKEIMFVAIGFALGIVFASAFYANLILFADMKKASEPTPELVTGRAAEEVIVRDVPIVAVSSYDDTGVVGTLEVRLIPGNSNVLIDTNPFLETDLQYSANIAVAVAKLESGKYGSEKDFVLSYDMDSAVVGGESAGAATALAVIAALQDKEIRADAAVTGTINHDGSIGRVAGILEKAKAVSDAGYRLFLVPEGQTMFKYYERVVEEEPTRFGFTLLNTRYVPKVVDLAEQAKKEWGLEIKEVSDIEDVMDYMLEG